MAATSTAAIGVKQRAIPYWLLDHKTASQFVGIILLAIVGFGVSAMMMNRTWEARDWVRHTSQVQLQIDGIVWHLLTLQQAIEMLTPSGGAEPIRNLVRLRDNIRNDLSAVALLTEDNREQQQRIAELNAAFGGYFVKLEQIVAGGAGNDVERKLAKAMSVDVGELSAIVGDLRNHEDGLLEQRTTRADIWLTVLLPTMSFSAALIASLVAFTARSINQSLREGEIVLSAKDVELAAKDMLMREIDHRVRNSLNLIYNLMTFQQRRTIDRDARALLAEAANQVLVVARVHERLYKYGSMEAVELGGYLRDLCADVASFALPADAQAAIQLQSRRADVSAEEAIWLGLIVVELITNALKYGNPSLQSPITVEVSPDERELRVVVSDCGAGLPPGFDLKSEKGLGMQVVLLLVRQLHATLEVDPAWSGTRFIVTMPLPAATAAKSLD